MARSRNIKPGFFLNEDLADLDPVVRLLFIGLWTIADKEGRLDDRPRRIKVLCLPYDCVDIDSCLDQLKTGGFIHRYSVGGDRYIQIVTWRKHQNPHHKEIDSTIPEFNAESELNQHVAHDKPKLDSSMDQDRPNKTTSSPLIPDSLNLIPDSLNHVNSDNKKSSRIKSSSSKLNYESWPSLPDKQLLADWLKKKKSAGGSVSQSAINTVGKELHIAVASGFTVDDCIGAAESAGWRGFKAAWMTKDDKSNGRSGRPEYMPGQMNYGTEITDL